MAKTVAIAPKNVPPKVGPTTANSWPAVDRKLACVSARSRSDMMCSFLLDGQLWILKPGIRMTDKTQHNSNFASVACVRANKGWRHYANNPLRNSTYVNPNYGITLYRIEKRKRCRRRGWSHCIKCHLIRNLFIKLYLWLSHVKFWYLSRVSRFSIILMRKVAWATENSESCLRFVRKNWNVKICEFEAC